MPSIPLLENTHQTFGKKTLTVLVTGFLAAALGLSNAGAAQADALPCFPRCQFSAYYQK